MKAIRSDSDVTCQISSFFSSSSDTFADSCIAKLHGNPGGGGGGSDLVKTERRMPMTDDFLPRFGASVDAEVDELTTSTSTAATARLSAAFLRRARNHSNRHRSRTSATTATPTPMPVLESALV